MPKDFFIPLRGKKKALHELLKKYYLSQAILVEKVTIAKDGSWEIQEAEKTKPDLYNFLLNNTGPNDYRLIDAVTSYTTIHFLAENQFVTTATRQAEAVQFLKKADLAFLKLIKKEEFIQVPKCGPAKWRMLQTFIAQYLN